MAGGEGGDDAWAKALQESTGPIPGEFEKEMKMKGLLSGQNKKGDFKLTANANLIRWLEEEGNVYLSESSSWGDAPHPMAISTETVDEITNESSGRGLLARRDINDGDELLMIPIKLCITKKSARKALGKDALPSEINEYLAMACQLIHEQFVKGEQSFWKPYMDVLPEVGEVNPTFTWSDEDLSFLEGSPIIAATRSLQMKLRREYDALLMGEGGLIAQFPDRFPQEVSAALPVCSPCVAHLGSMTHPCFINRSSNLRSRTGSGPLQCYSRVLFVSATSDKAKVWQWFRMLIL
jgi:hypothetical protein